MNRLRHRFYEIAIRQKANYPEECQQHNQFGNLPLSFFLALDINQRIGLVLLLPLLTQGLKFRVERCNQGVCIQLHLAGIGSNIPFEKQLGINLAVIPFLDGLDYRRAQVLLICNV